MNKQNFDINKLRVASPCSVRWETMVGDECIRFCNFCELNVYNFSAMTTDEICALVTKSEGRICGRLYKRADGKVLTKDCPVGLRAYRKHVSRFAGATLAAILGLFSVSFGQKENEKSIDVSKTKIVRKANQESFLSGTIVDQTGAVIPNAEITIFKDTDEKKLKITSDETGFFKSPLLSAGIYTLEVKFAGFAVFQLTQIEVKENEQISIDVILKPDDNFLMGDIVVIAPETKKVDIKTLPLVKISKPKNSKKH